MAESDKIVFIGAGRAAFGPGMFRDILARKELAGSTAMISSGTCAESESASRQWTA